MQRICSGLILVLLFLSISGCSDRLLFCSREGEQIWASNRPEKCCLGLKEVAGGADENDCSKPSGLGGIIKCSNCGNGICDRQNLENKCNCPKDCKSL